MTVHGTAEILDVSTDEHEGFRDYCTGIYDDTWTSWLDSASYERINAARMFTFHLDPRA